MQSGCFRDKETGKVLHLPNRRLTVADAARVLGYGHRISEFGALVVPNGMATDSVASALEKHSHIPMECWQGMSNDEVLRKRASGDAFDDDPYLVRNTFNKHIRKIETRPNLSLLPDRIDP